MRMKEREVERLAKVHEYDPNRFRTRISEEVAMQEAEEREEKEMREELKKMNLEKKDEYARYVRE